MNLLVVLDIWVLRQTGKVLHERVGEMSWTLGACSNVKYTVSWLGTILPLQCGLSDLGLNLGRVLDR